MRLLIALAALALAAAPASAEPTPTATESGFAGALKACETWVLNPTTWADGSTPFEAAVGLGDRLSAVDKIDETALPPPQLRQANHYWRITAGADAAYTIVVSDVLPVCHMTGGGKAMVRPGVEAVLASTVFADHWEQTDEETNAEVVTKEYRSRAKSNFFLIVSVVKNPGPDLEKLQVLATAFTPITR